jgi:NAD(P)-dependent dehydrogenase (short-subunit alcohol dehydrogenase family)
VRVNCVSPGWIMTGDYASLRRKDHAQHPVGRVGKPQDIAEMVAFLLDGEHSGFHHWRKFHYGRWYDSENDLRGIANFHLSKLRE